MLKELGSRCEAENREETSGVVARCQGHDPKAGLLALDEEDCFLMPAAEKQVLACC